MPNGILITGLNGCGKSTVCKLLARKLNYFSMDVEDYYFIKSDIPYSKFHTLEQTRQLMLDDIQEHGDFVLATVNCDWGNDIASMCKLAVVLRAPLATRMERIKYREYDKFGDRVLRGGDLYESQQKFHNKVLERGEDHMAKQMQFIKCPTIEVDAVLSVEDVIDTIYQKFLQTVFSEPYSENNYC